MQAGEQQLVVQDAAQRTTEQAEVMTVRTETTKQRRNIADSLAMPGAADIDFEPPRVTIGLKAADFS